MLGGLIAAIATAHLSRLARPGSEAD